jgi:tetratricopeptide (TPR) repeat protein
MRRLAFVLAGIAVIAGCAQSGEREPPPAASTAAGAVPFFTGLGTHHRAIATSKPEAQKYFDQGLAFLYGFNHDEAIRAFTAAAQADPACAMAYWGIAYASGPHINNPVVTEARAQAAWEALGKAREHAARANEADRALIEALGARYAWPQPQDRALLDAAYAEAVRSAYAVHPKDADVAALFAEALMDLHPWDLWNQDGTSKAWTPEIVSVLEDLLAWAPAHPLGLHLYIHAVEASPEPGKADRAAATLRELMPGVGHMVHMPSHIDVRRGRWEQAIVTNTKAMAADRAYRERVPRQNFYRLYMAHNHHMLTFAAMMVGQSELALATIRDMVAGMPAEWLQENAAFADGWVAMPMEVLMRFGRWQEILHEPEPPEYLPLSRALRHYARGVAHAALDDVEAARAEQATFAAAKAKVPESVLFGNNTGLAILGVAEKVLEGEILYRAGEEEAGFAALRESVQREDALRYDEPPGWIQPVRHALGAALLQSGRYAEAEAVFRADLDKLPDNGWALFGMARALRLQKKDAEAADFEARFETAWKSADVKISSPCLCLRGV